MATLTGVECRDLWMSFITANYLPNVEAQGSSNCPDCDSTRECNNHYCLACKEGGLCPAKFKTNQPHDHHPWLQVRKVTKENVVIATEVETFLGNNASKIQKFIGNSKNVFKLRTPAKTTPKKTKVIDKNLKHICGGCNLSISKTTNSKVGVEVCSIECLIIYAEQKHQLECLKFKEDVDLQGQDYVHPLTMEEKIQLQLQKNKKNGAFASKSKPSVPILELGAPTTKDKDDSRAHHPLVLVPIKKRKYYVAMTPTPMSKQSMSLLKVNASTTKKKDNRRACAPTIGQTWKKKTSVATMMVKDEEDKEALQAKNKKTSTIHVAQIVGPSKSQALVYNYSTFPLGYQWKNLDILCEAFDLDKELTPLKLKEKKNSVAIEN